MICGASGGAEKPSTTTNLKQSAPTVEALNKYPPKLRSMIARLKEKKREHNCKQHCPQLAHKERLPPSSKLLPLTLIELGTSSTCNVANVRCKCRIPIGNCSGKKKAAPVDGKTSPPHSPAAMHSAC